METDLEFLLLSGRLVCLRLGGSLAFSLVVIAVEWGLVTPALVYLSEVRSFDGLAGTGKV